MSFSGLEVPLCPEEKKPLLKDRGKLRAQTWSHGALLQKRGQRTAPTTAVEGEGESASGKKWGLTWGSPRGGR